MGDVTFWRYCRFSALQRAEIAEIGMAGWMRSCTLRVSVLFNEPKLLKLIGAPTCARWLVSFSALQRAEIAEIGGSSGGGGR